MSFRLSRSERDLSPKMSCFVAAVLLKVPPPPSAPCSPASLGDGAAAASYSATASKSLKPVYFATPDLTKESTNGPTAVTRVGQRERLYFRECLARSSGS